MVILLLGLTYPQNSPDILDTLYQDDDFYFVADSNYIFLDSSIHDNYIGMTFKDVPNNLALTFHLYYTGDLQGLVNKHFSPSNSMEPAIDSLNKDTLSESHFYKFATSNINDTLSHITFSMGKKYGDRIIIFANAAYGTLSGLAYMAKFNDFNFTGKVDTTIIDTNTVGTKSDPTRIKWIPSKKMLMMLDGWVYNIKGVRAHEFKGM